MELEKEVFIEIDPAKLLARRAALNLPQKVIAARTGKPAYYIKLEIGVSRRVCSATLERLARVLECSQTNCGVRDERRHKKAAPRETLTKPRTTDRSCPPHGSQTTKQKHPPSRESGCHNL